MYFAFIDLTKAFDLVSRDGLINGLIGCLPKFCNLVRSFLGDMKATIHFDSKTSESFSIFSRDKQGCVLASNLFGIFFSILLRHAFGASAEGIYLHTRIDSQLFNLTYL